MTIEQLRVERLRSPVGIIVPHPEFTWTLASSRPGERQTACELVVENVAPDGTTSLVWQSGKLTRSLGESIHYAGASLQSRGVYQWRLRVWDGEGQPSAWSDRATFEMGLTAPDSWGAQWISGGNAPRGSFPVRDGLAGARAYVTGLGYYECFCNGIRVSQADLAPSMTEFERRIEYEIIDLGPHLAPGDNSLGFLLGDGWWRHGADARQRPLQAIGQVVLEYADGHHETFGTDGSWQAAAGPLFEDTSPHQVFDGVNLDLAWLQNIWINSEKDSVSWIPAQVVEANSAELVPSLLPPVRATEILQPLSVQPLTDSLVAVDFGQNFTGRVRFRARGVKGSRAVLRHAELRDAQGRLNTATLRSARQIDSFSLAGAPEGEIVEPRLLYHGFRYAEIETGADVTPGSIEGVVMHTDLDRVGHVTTSDARLNWLFDSLRWTVRSNAFSVMTDCSQRDERRGWMMDGLSGFKAGLLDFDLNALGRKWLTDMLDNQQPDGSLRGDAAPMWGPCRSLGWQRALVLLPMALYDNYGDMASLRRALPAMQRYADFLLSNLEEGLLPDSFSHHPAEWLCVGRSLKGLSENALAIDVLRHVARALRAVNEAGDAGYDTAADQIAAAAHCRWFDAPSACYGGGEGFAQSSQVYALRFGITPPEERQRVFDRLVDDLMIARGEGPFVTTGIGSTEHLPIVLSEFGRDDLVWQWLQRDAYPGYGFMHRNGATAIWERWEHMAYHQMNAHNHTGLTGIGVWLREHLVGIRPQPGPEPVFQLNPAVHLPLQSLQASWNSHWGQVAIGWQGVGAARVLRVSIPAGCSGVLTLPGRPGAQQLSSGHHEIGIQNSN